jgi:hypothetical protein
MKSISACLFALLLATSLGACNRESATSCELRYRIGGHSGGFYPQRPEGPGRLDTPWMFEAAFVNWQNEAGGSVHSEFKLLQPVLMESGENLVEDCIQIRSREVTIKTDWQTGGLAQSMDTRPVSVTFHFYGDDEKYLKSITYPIPTRRTEAK